MLRLQKVVGDIVLATVILKGEGETVGNVFFHFHHEEKVT